MTPRWESPLERPSPRDAALLAEVLGSLGSQLEGANTGEQDEAELAGLISAAVAELHRVMPHPRAEAGIVPVLGTGVVQEILRRRRDPVADLPEPAMRHVDHKL